MISNAAKCPKYYLKSQKTRRAEIEEKIGYELDWDRFLDSDQPKRHEISTWGPGSNTIGEYSKEDLEESGDWHVNDLFTFAQVFTDEIDRSISRLLR